MYQHPVPQNVTSYEFRLIGDMTLKQFLELAGGGGIAALFYLTNLPGPLKWLFIIFSVLIGIALAFVPFEERPLDRWISAFFKSAYSATQYTWKKSAVPPPFLQPSTSPPPPPPQEDDQKTSLLKQQQVDTFLQTLPQETAIPIDQQEAKRLNQISTLFTTITPTTITTTPLKHIPPHSPKINLRPLKLTPEEGAQVLRGEIDLAKTSASVLMSIPKDEPIEITKKPPSPPPKKTPSSPPHLHPVPSRQLQPPPTPIPASIAATTSTKLPFPTTPTTPNTLVGMVLDSTGKIVESAIVEVRDQSNAPVRAFKTNKLGQFFSATPLKTGQYRLEVEKPGLNFDILSLNLRGEIIPPLEIKAKNAQNLS